MKLENYNIYLEKNSRFLFKESEKVLSEKVSASRDCFK